MSWLDGRGGHVQRQPWRLISEPQKRVRVWASETHQLQEPTLEVLPVPFLGRGRAA